MAINHVYLVDRDVDNSVFAITNDFFSQFQLGHQFPTMTANDVEFINLVAQHLSSGKKENTVAAILNRLASSSKNMAAKILYHIVNNYDDSEPIDSKDESIFIERALSPLLNEIFPVGGDLKKDGNFTALIDNTDMKPDIKYKARIGANDFDFLVFEVKRPRSIAEDDLFKVSIELQFMLNRMIQKKISQPVVYGVVVKGFACDVYRMELVAPSVYLFNKIQTFYIPRSVYDFHVLLGAIPALLKLEQLVVNEVSKARRDIESDENDKLGWVRSPRILIKNS